MSGHGAIGASVLVSELTDTPSLDYVLGRVCKLILSNTKHRPFGRCFVFLWVVSQEGFRALLCSQVVLLVAKMFSSQVKKD